MDQAAQPPLLSRAPVTVVAKDKNSTPRVDVSSIVRDVRVTFEVVHVPRGSLTWTEV
jgi:hypothetical protein